MVFSFSFAHFVCIDSDCSSGYQLFSKEMLVQLKDVRANERLQEIGRRWVALSEDEKKQWNKKKDVLWVQYNKDLAKFKRVGYFVSYIVLWSGQFECFIKQLHPIKHFT